MKDINVYVNKDGRARAYIKETQKVVSYPRLILEEKLGRPLKKNEQAHHKDLNHSNNDPDNIELTIIGEHQRFHNPQKYFDKEVECAWCGKIFIWTAIQQRRHPGNHSMKSGGLDTLNKPFCSKSCCGKYGAHVQKIRAGMAK